MVNYFNLLDDEDEDTTTTVVEQKEKEKEKEKEQLVKPAVYVPPLRTSTEATNKVVPLSQHIEIQFDFDSKDLDETLPERWNIWYDTKRVINSTEGSIATAADDQYLQNVQKVGSFNTLKELRNLWNSLKTPLEVIGNISIFKEGIEPAWEDAKNKDGGKISVNYLKDNGDFAKVFNAWFTLFTTIVYASFENYEQSNGIVLSIRSWGASISLWNSSSEQDKVQSIRESFHNILSVKYTKYSIHKTAIQLKNNKKDEKINNVGGINQQYKKKRDEHGFTIKPYNVNTQLIINPAFSGAYEKQWVLDQQPQQQQPNVPTIASTSKLTTNSNKISVKKSPLYTVNTEDRKEIVLESDLAEQHQQQRDQQQSQKESTIEIPTGVNAWSTGLLLGPKAESNVTVNEQQPIGQEEKEEKEPKSKKDNSKSSSAYSNAWSTQKSESPSTSSETSTTIAKSTATINTNIEIPTGVNAWATGKLLVPSEPSSIVSEKKSNSSEKLIADDKSTTEKKQAATLVEKKEKKASLSVEKKDQDKPIKRVNSKEVLQKAEVSSTNTTTSDSFWEDPEPVSTPAPVKKVEVVVSTPVVVESHATESFSKVVKKDKSYKNNNNKNQPQPSSWSASGLSIAELIAKQPEPVIPSTSNVEQTNTASTTVNIVKVEVQSPNITTTTATTTTTTTANTTSTTASTNSESAKSGFLQIKESKKVEVLEVIKTETEEWKSVEKKQKTTKQITADKEKKDIGSIKGPQDNLLIRNLIVEEPLEYLSPVKPIKKPSQPTQSSQTKEKESKSTKDQQPSNTIKKTTKKQSDINKSTSTNNSKLNNNKQTKSTTSNNNNNNIKESSIISPSLKMNLIAVFAVLVLGFILKYLFA